MKIQTKFSIGDSVYFLYENKIVNYKVSNITIYVNEEIPSIFYEIEELKDRAGFTFKFSEKEVFSTKKELIKNL